MNFITVVIILPPIMIMIGIGLWILRQGQRNLHVELDGRLTQLLKVTEALARAQGLAEGIEQERGRFKDLKPKDDVEGGSSGTAHIDR